MRCRSGRHDWSNPISASRCCATGWTRELRFGASDRVPGDAEGGETVIDGGGGQMLVWHYDPASQPEE